MLKNDRIELLLRITIIERNENTPVTSDKSNDDQAQCDQFPVFPLPIFMLAGGVQRLRIFEPSALSMITEATKSNGFIITLRQNEEDMVEPKWGTHVQIVDFGLGSDGILTIDVLGLRMVMLSDFQTQKKGILVATATTLPHWSCNHDPLSFYCHHVHSLTEVHSSLAVILENVFLNNRELSRLYQTHYLNYAEWVYARLLEIVPLSLNEKEKFVYQLEFMQLEQVLGSLCEKIHIK